MNTFMTILAAMTASFKSKKNKRGYSNRKRWDWKSGPTPKAGSRRWRAMIAYRQSIQGTV
jgi:hypothetical protein